MSLFIDPRIGSGDLAPLLENLGIRTVLTMLKWERTDLYGEGGPDCEWLGIGCEGPVTCGVEVKTVNDVLQSMQNGSLASKIRGLVNSYDRAYLIVEEVTRPGEEGVLEHYVKGKWWTPAKLGSRHGGFQYTALEKYLYTISERAHVRIGRTVNRTATAQLVGAWYRWWQEGEDAHESILGLDKSTQIKLAEKVRLEKGQGISLLRTGPSFTRRVAAELPGIGVERSGIIAGAFTTVKEMCDAKESDWTKLPGIGKDTAKKVRKALSEAEGDAR